jgi:hypothetical protein
MDIGKKLYQELTPKQRAIAAYGAVNRNDQSEIDRLMGTAPRGRKHGQAIWALAQALNAYNCLTSRTTTTYLVVSGRLHAALSFCIAWLDAGGAIDNSEYRKRADMVEELTPLREQLADEVAAILQAAREWCEKNQIPVDFFSGILCSSPLPEEIGEKTCDSETLNTVRSVFDKITLVW